MHIRLFMFLLSWCGEPRSILSVHRDHLSFFNSEDEGNRQATNARELSFLFRSRASNQVGRGRARIPYPNYLPTRKCIPRQWRSKPANYRHVIIRSQQHCWSTPTKLLWHMPIGKMEHMQGSRLSTSSFAKIRSTENSPFSPGSKSACDSYQIFDSRART